MSTQPTNRVVTGKVRFCYANVFQATAMNEGDNPKYNVCIVIDKGDEATIKKINDAIAVAKELGKPKISDKAGRIPANLKTPLRDGDAERPDDDAFAGKLFINANSSQKPGIVDKDLNHIIDPEEFYSGCYGRASVTFYAYNSNGSKGIACGLNNLQKLEEGERLAGGASAEQDFGDELAE